MERTRSSRWTPLAEVDTDVLDEVIEIASEIVYYSREQLPAVFFLK
jgi:hypothetical protein